MKMPEPIIEPMTIIVASVSPSPRTSFGAASASARGMGIGSMVRGGSGRSAGSTRNEAGGRLSFPGDERLDVGDGLVERLATPVGQGGIEGALVNWLARWEAATVGVRPFGADLGEIAVVDPDLVRRRVPR